MSTKDTELLDVSLIIATYNEEESLGYVLNEIKDFNIGEIIIIDKNSTDNTKNIAEKYSVKFITQSREGWGCLLYTSPSPRDATVSRMPSSA